MENGILMAISVLSIVLYCACLAVMELVCILLFLRKTLKISDEQVRENHSDSELRFLYTVLTLLLFKLNYLVYLLYF